jgi:hypothetical protein
MIYIWKDTFPPFAQLGRLISYELGVPNEITDDLSKEGTWIIFFTSYFHHRHILAGRKYIVVQTENLNESALLQNGGKEEYIKFLNGAYDVWDYTTNFRLGYSKFYELEYEESKDIDVLFYGSVNERRRLILSQIPNIVVLNSPGHIQEHHYPMLWNYIRRSKITLCVNYYDNSNADVVRLVPLLSNRTFFIAEKTIDPIHNSRTEYVVCDYEKIPEMCSYYLSNPKERLKYIDSGFQYIKNNPFSFPNIYSERNADNV